MTFVVPDVESGVYWIDVCADAGCSIGVGDLIGGSLAVASTRLETKALTVLPDLKARVRNERHIRRRLQDRVDSLRDARIAEVDAGGSGQGAWRTLAIASLIALACLTAAAVRIQRRVILVPER